jgi:hypothetical protein
VKRTKALRLVLLGGGVAAVLAACGDDDSRRRECERARAELRKDAEEVCRRSTTRSASGSSWFNGRTSAAAAGATSVADHGTSSRSGFGASASAHGSGGG